MLHAARLSVAGVMCYVLWLYRSLKVSSFLWLEMEVWCLDVQIRMDLGSAEVSRPADREESCGTFLHGFARCCMLYV